MAAYYAPLLWPPWKWLARKLRRRAFTLARHQEALLADAYEPVIWMFDVPEATPQRPGRFGYHWNAAICGWRHISTWHAFKDDREVYGNDTICIYTRHLLGLVNFCDTDVPFRAIQQALGEDTAWRIPQEKSMRYCDEQIRYVPEALITRVQHTPWPELVVLAGLAYAKSGLLYIAPHPLPPHLVKQARAAGKAVYHIPLAQFGAAELRQLQVCPGLSCPLWVQLTPDDDVNDPHLQAEITIRYECYMRPFWPGDSRTP